ncbi:peptidoglycan-binding domain-containing protein [Pseudovibrio exalbescens]|uniref:peptidoglycan-binding domain-containing protein n=1 Tax=Pseudovibrio exalbescens TaxID=197461 RepID=UPI002367150B|nr:peptidoglycan-binding domain-containing protein [Pseudovibrio exalbescens]MDD7908503.1 peptidoglycan-binding domain-containing protein [Pseudovibrio exalbescens]
MRTGTKVSGAVAMALGLTLSASTALAGAGDFLVGVGVGAIGKTIYDKVTRKPSAPPQSIPQASNPQREQNRDIQNRLNVLGYNAGTPDGIVGRKTRGAINAFQTDKGFPATGTLNDEELALLYQLTTPTNNAESTSSIPVGKSDLPSDEKDTTRAGALQTAPPAIHGLTPGLREENVIAFLESEGYQTCEGDQTYVRCSADLDTMVDAIEVATVNDTIYMIYRDLNFKTEVPREALVNRMRDTYPTLIDEETMSLSSSTPCQAKLETPMLSVVAPVSNAPTDPNVLGAAAQACADYAGIELSGDPIVTRTQILLYDSAPILHEQESGAGIFEETNAVPTELKF